MPGAFALSGLLSEDFQPSLDARVDWMIFRSFLGGELIIFTKMLLYAPHSIALGRTMTEYPARGKNGMVGFRMDVVSGGCWCQISSLWYCCR